MTDPQARELIAFLAAVYPNQTITADTVAGYSRHLTDLDAREAATAVAALIDASKWFPTIAEIRAEVRRQFDPFGWRARFGDETTRGLPPRKVDA